MEKKKKETVVGKVVKSLALTMLGINIVAIAMILAYAQSELLNTEEDYLAEIVDNITSTVEARLNDYISSAEIIALNSGIIDLMNESNKANPMDQNPNIDKILSEISAITSSFGGGVEVIALVDADQDGYIMHNGTTSSPSQTMTTRPCYAAATARQTIVTEPYVHEVTNSNVISVATPVFSNGNVIGVITLNIPTTFLAQLTTNFGDTGTTWMIDNSKNVLAHTTTSHIGNSYSAIGISGADFASEVSNPTGKLITFDNNGTTRTGIINSIPGLGWILVGSLDQAEFKASSVTLSWVLVVIQALCVVGAIAVCGNTVVKLLKPIEELNHSMTEMSKGNLKELPTHEGNDEIGQLCDNLRSTMSTLGVYIQEIKANLDAFGQGDFTRKTDVEFIGDFSAIQTSTEEFVYLITSTLDSIKLSVEQVNGSSHFVASGSQNLAEGSIKQAESVNVLNVNIENITKSVSENVKNVEYVNDCSHQAADELSKSNSKMDEMVIAMRNIQESSEAIQKIIKTIEDVAFQTNILALNAAVEAARAGSAGQGFAVVADEVRNLAARTSGAVKETVQLIGESELAVNTGSRLVEETARSLTDAIEFVNGYMSTLDTVTDASKGQAIAIEEINIGVGEITSVMQNNTAISEESAAASEELSSQANVMKDSIEKFKLD